MASLSENSSAELETTAAKVCEGAVATVVKPSRCSFPNQLFLNHLPRPIHPHCSRMVPRPCQCAAGAWRPSESFLGPGLERPDCAQIAPGTKVTPPPASQPDHLRWCWLVFCDALTPPDQNDHSAACVCRFLRVRFLDLRMGGGDLTLEACGGALGTCD